MIFPPQGYKNISYKWLNQGMIFRPHGSYSAFGPFSFVVHWPRGLWRRHLQIKKNLGPKWQLRRLGPSFLLVLTGARCWCWCWRTRSLPVSRKIINRIKKGKKRETYLGLETCCVSSPPLPLLVSSPHPSSFGCVGHSSFGCGGASFGRCRRYFLWVISIDKTKKKKHFKLELIKQERKKETYQRPRQWNSILSFGPVFIVATH